MRKLLLAFAVVGMSATLQAQNYKLWMNSGEFIPKQELVAKDLWPNSQIVDGKYYGIIQLKGIPNEEQKNALKKLGVNLFQYLPEFAWIASVDASIDWSQISSEMVRAFLPITDDMKMHHSFKGVQPPSWAMNGSMVEVNLVYFPDVKIGTLREQIAQLGLKESAINERMHTIRVSIHKDKLTLLNQIKGVYYFDYFDVNPQPDGVVNNSVVRGNMLNTGTTSGLQYDGTGVRVALNDDGIIGPHIDYTGRIYTSPVSFNTGNHGDHCAGIIFGAGNRDPLGVGAAPGAELGVFGVSGQYTTGYQAFDMISTLYTQDSVTITSTSYGNGNNSGYNTLAAQMDDDVNTMRNLMHVFSAGNSGTSDYGYGAGAGWGNITGGHKQGKNVIAVGNVNMYDQINASSSRGPAYDGRIKPEVVAQGTNVYSTVDPNTYVLMSGTSMACPSVAGVLAQLTHGYKLRNNGDLPPSIVLKTALMNTADDLGQPGPDFIYGYGRVNAKRANKLISSGNYYVDTIIQSATRPKQINVPGGTKQLRVMLYWHDTVAAVNASKALVNNLDLYVAHSSGSYLPWVLNHAANATTLNAAATRGIDDINNMEQVTIDNPTPGNWTINVLGKVVPAVTPGAAGLEYAVAYEFVRDTVEITYPIGGEAFTPNETVIVRWDAYKPNGSYNVELSDNGGSNYTTIATNIPDSITYFAWTVPSNATPSSNYRIRINQGGRLSASQNFSIIDIPTNIRVNWVCADSMEVECDTVRGAMGYTVSVLDGNYMKQIGSSTSNKIIVKGYTFVNDGWFSINAVTPQGGNGRRALAQTYPAAFYQCPVYEDLEIVEIIKPTADEISNCFSSGTVLSDSLIVKVRNNGNVAETDIEFEYTVNGTTNVFIYNDTIPRYDSAIIVISNSINFVGNARNNISVYIPGLDRDMTNNFMSTTKFVGNATTIRPPYVYNFDNLVKCDVTTVCGYEACNTGLDWFNYTEVGKTAWYVNNGPTPTRAATTLTGPLNDYNKQDSTGKYLYIESSNCDTNSASLMSPCIDLTNVTGDVSFRVAYHMHVADTAAELSLHVLSNNVWTKLRSIKGTQFDLWHVLNETLNPYKGQVIQLRIDAKYNDSGYNDIAIDDIRLNLVNASIEDAELNDQNLIVTPNPSNGVYALNVYNVKGQLDIQITDISGKLISQKSLNIERDGISVPIDIKGFADGVYLLKVSNDNSSWNKKLIKQ